MSDLNFILWAIPAMALLLAFAVLALQFRGTISDHLKQTVAAAGVSGAPAAGAPSPAANPACQAEELPRHVSRWSDSPAAAVQNHDPLSRENFARICGRFGIREVSVLPSDARGRAGASLWILVEFENDATVDYSVIYRLRQELLMVLGRPVDLVSKNNLERAGLREVLAQARVVYAA